MTTSSREAVSLEELIAGELKYFEPMIARARRSTKEQREEWLVRQSESVMSGCLTRYMRCVMRFLKLTP